ncbi:hypothetical protein [Sphingobium sp. Ndbn-10]|uniref:hypothetical protein n=1 Tax=Sphingobium sp. Ndbn-10 TaxID=1667223 RepID=UPI001112A26D|nr:hypothetical protein [Sphingobium sp. Ndbn-10]
MQTRLIHVVSDEAKTDWSKLMHDSFAASHMVAKGIGSLAKDAGWDKISESKVGKAFGNFRNAFAEGRRAQGELIAAASTTTLRSAKSLFKKSAAGSVEIENVSLDFAEKYFSKSGRKLLPGYIYAQHPLREDDFFIADALHTEILKEQRAQIIRYFRSSVALKFISIEIYSHNTGNFYTSSGWGKASGSASREFDTQNRRWFAATYNEPAREPLAENTDLFWMPYFDEIAAAIEGGKSGTIETITTINTSFGIAASAADAANIKSDWLSQQNFIVKAEYD